MAVGRGWKGQINIGRGYQEKWKIGPCNGLCQLFMCSDVLYYVKRVPVCWKSKAQRSVTLSSTEAEWIALSEATKEIIFVVHLLESLGIKVNPIYPATPCQSIPLQTSLHLAMPSPAIKHDPPPQFHSPILPHY